MVGLDGGGYGLGVDLGTSHTVAVLRWPDGRTRPLLFDGQPILPSGVFLDPSGRAYVGRDAQRLAQADPARYEPNPKRRIDEPVVLLGDREVPTAELLAAVLRAVAAAAVEAVGFLPPAVLTYPAAWGARRREVLAAAVARAGWPPVAATTTAGPDDSDEADPTVPLHPTSGAPAGPATTAGPGTTPLVPAPRPAGGGTLLVPEPVAAARYFTDVLRRPVPVGAALVVFDFGGGTLDIAVVRNEGLDGDGRPRLVVIGSGGVPDLGGLDLDAALVQHLGTIVGTTHGPVWQQLNQPVTAAQWRNRRQLWDDVRGAKEMLSRAATAPVPVPGIEQALHLTRDELERVVTPLLRRGVVEAATVIENCRLTVDHLAGLFLVGGSSRVPLVARLLHAELKIAPTVLEQPELPVAEGALAALPAPTASPVGVRTAALAGVPGTPPGIGGGVPGSPAALPLPPGVPRGGAPAGLAPGNGAPVGMAPGGGVPVGGVPAGMPSAAYPVGPNGVGGPPAGGPARPAGWVGLLRGRAVWLGAGAVVALAAVVAAAVLYLTRDPYPALDFAPFAEIDRIAPRESESTTMLTTTGGDRAYVGYQRSDSRLDVAVVDAATAKVTRWITTNEAADRWLWLQALPNTLVVRGGGYGTSSPGLLVAVNPVTGETRWSRRLNSDTEVHSYDSYVVLLDRTADTIVGINARTGQEWSLPSPKGEYGGDSMVEPVHTAGEYGGPADAHGNHTLPNRGEEPQLVEIGADGSIRVIDVAAGTVLKERKDAADTDDVVLAYEGQLFVAPKTDGYGLKRFDLKTLGTPTTVYTAPDQRRRPVDLLPCGAHQVCLLETVGSDTTTARLVAIRTDEARVAWEHDVPKAERLRAVGENVVAQTTTSPRLARLFTPDGRKVLEREGVALRIDGGNVLLFDDEPSSTPENASLAGVVAKSGELTQLGLVKEVVGGNCSWTTSVLVCPSRSDFVLTRFVAE